jgi:hypothetical protein
VCTPVRFGTASFARSASSTFAQMTRPPWCIGGSTPVARYPTCSGRVLTPCYF